MSKMALAMRSRMHEMSDVEFEGQLGLSKAEFLEHLDEMANIEARCIAETGMPAPDFAAHLLDDDGGVSTEMLTLSNLAPMPIGLIFGCYTCPIFRRQTNRMKEIIRRYENQIRFVFVYVIEAHPTDGWNTPSNKAENIMYRQPQDLSERAAIAHAWRDAFELQKPIVLDWPDNRINEAYSGSPERLYVLDSERVVRFKSEQGPYEDSHLDDWAQALANVL
jgi:hypothetical protein